MNRNEFEAIFSQLRVGGGSTFTALDHPSDYRTSLSPGYFYDYLPRHVSDVTASGQGNLSSPINDKPLRMLFVWGLRETLAPAQSTFLSVAGGAGVIRWAEFAVDFEDVAALNAVVHEFQVACKFRGDVFLSFAEAHLPLFTRPKGADEERDEIFNEKVQRWLRDSPGSRSTTLVNQWDDTSSEILLQPVNMNDDRYEKHGRAVLLQGHDWSNVRQSLVDWKILWADFQTTYEVKRPNFEATGIYHRYKSWNMPVEAGFRLLSNLPGCVGEG